MIGKERGRSNQNKEWDKNKYNQAVKRDENTKGKRQEVRENAVVM